MYTEAVILAATVADSKSDMSIYIYTLMYCTLKEKKNLDGVSIDLFIF